MSNRISKIRVKGVDYEVKSNRSSKTKIIDSLSSIPVDVESIIANVSSSTNFSLASNMNKGDHIDLLCIPSSNFQQEISGDNIKTSFNGNILAKIGQPFELHINCYDTNKIFIDVSNVKTIGLTYYITVYASPGGYGELYKYRDNTHTSYDTINLDELAGDNLSIKIDDLKYGFRFSYSYCDKIDLTGLNTYFITNMSNMFSNCDSVKSLDLSNFDTSNVTDMGGMFSGCLVLTSLDLSNFDTSKVTDMRGMFSDCYAIKFSELRNFDTSNVTDMSIMFNNCGALTSLDLSNFDTSSVTDMKQMFDNCQLLTSLDLSSFDTSNVTNMSSMFNSCIALTSLDLSNFDTSNVTKFGAMFYYCDSLNHIKCKQAFKNWCWTNQDTINLPDAMRDGGGGTWEIVD